MPTINGLTAERMSQIEAAAKLGFLEGIPIGAYGHSGLYVGLGSPVPVYPYSTSNYFDMVARRIEALNSPGQGYAVGGLPLSAYWNNGIPGALMADATIFAYSNLTYVTRRSILAAGIPVLGTWTPSIANAGLLIVDALGNSAHRDSLDSTKMRVGTVNALDSLIRLLRSQAVVQDTNGAFSYGAGWSSFANISLPGGNEHYTTTNGAIVTITTPKGTDFDLVLPAFDDAVVGTPGAAFTVKVDGTPFTWAWNPTTISNQMSMSTSIFTGAATTAPMVIPIRGLSNAVHTIELKHNDTAGKILAVSQLLVASKLDGQAAPLIIPTIVIVKVAKSTAAGYSAGGGDWATDQIYNAMADTVAARFPNDGSIQTWDPNVHGWDANMMASAIDVSGHLHSNNLGMKCYADGIIKLMQALPLRQGLQLL